MVKIGIIDADLIGRRRHRFPNLVCMKLSGYHKACGDEVKLKTNYDNLDAFEKLYIAKVFTDTPIPETDPLGLTKGVLNMPNVEYGGTGFYYDKAVPLKAEIEHHMPDYHLYDEWIRDKPRKEVKAYVDYSIGFLTRGCFRHCAFCVNRRYNKVLKHAPLDEFLDKSRKKICLLDDNFFGYANWRELLMQLRDSGKAFQFKQGLDARLLDEEKADLLFKSNYDGDFIFAFDNIQDKYVIEEKLKLIRKHTNKRVKFYCFTGYDRANRYDIDFWKQDIVDLLDRVSILLKYECFPYVMRFAKVNGSPYKDLYSTIAAWCNQAHIIAKMSLLEFAEKSGGKRFSSISTFADISEWVNMKIGRC